MAKKLIDILSDAAVVRDETNEKANTAERVGGVLVELANYLSAFAPVSNVTVEADGANVRLVLHLKNEDGTVSTRGVTLPAASTENAGVLTTELLKALQATDRSETASRQAADAELLKRIIGKSTSSSAYTDPFKYLKNFASEKDENGTITKHAIRVMQDYLLETLRHSDFRDSFPYIGHMRAHVEGVPIEVWNYVKSWNTASTNGVFVQVVRTNFGLNNGVISSALTESFHEYHRTVTVGMANGSVTDVTATAWKESNADISDMAEDGISKADAALAKIAAEAKERAAADKANEDLAQEGISKAESASAMLFAEEEAREKADKDLNDLIEAEVTERLQSVATEAAARKAADAELQAKIQDASSIADEGLDKADSALSQIHEERQERAAQDRTLAEAVSQERAARTAADAELQAKISETRENTAKYLNQLKEKVDANTESINAETEARTSADAELQAKISDHEDRIWKLENQWYGIEWDTEVSSPAVTRIGNMDLHRTLPIQSRMRGCLLDDDGKVTKYLNPKDWTGEVRDGSRGQVMVEIPMHYRRCETEGTKRRVKMSEYPLPGFLPIPKMYPAAYEASLQRSTKKLCSVVNTDPDYRGGNNQAAWDGTYRSLLGRPVTGINRTGFRTYARNRNNAATAEWNLYTYHVHKAIYWLYVVEYANRNSQLPFTAELTAEGFRQGGLGAGVSDWSWSSWNTFNNVNPFVPCGHTDILGNSTGVVAYTAYNADGSELKTFNVPRYRGVENPFGHIWKWTDGINVRISPTEANGGDNLSKVFVCEDPSKLNDTNYNGYKYVGNEARTDGFIRDIIFGEDGEIMPSLVGGNSTQFFCDYHATNIPTTEKLCGVLFGGHAYSNVYGGVVCTHSVYAPTTADVISGSRLCFLPAE